MIWHPLTWAFWSAVLTGGLIYTLALIRAASVLTGWTPEKADIDQLRREQDAETAALLAQWSLAILTVAALLGLVGTAVVWHRVIPGAMCGTGVLQAMGTHGSRALIFWGITLSIMFAWQVLDRLNRHHPQALLTQPASRVMISAAPFLTLALFYSWQALMRIESVPPVSCCAAVYDQVLNSTSGSTASQWLASASLWGSLAGSAALLVMAGLKIRLPDRGSGAKITVLTIVWAPMASLAVKQTWSTYYYQVLSHPCPWCLFLPDYYGVGFMIFGLLAVILMQSIALWLADRTRRRHPLLTQPAVKRIRRAACLMTMALIGFTILTMAPAVAWRLRTGAWLDGSF